MNPPHPFQKDGDSVICVNFEKKKKTFLFFFFLLYSPTSPCILLTKDYQMWISISGQCFCSQKSFSESVLPPSPLSHPHPTNKINKEKLWSINLVVQISHFFWIYFGFSLFMNESNLSSCFYFKKKKNQQKKNKKQKKALQLILKFLWLTVQSKYLTRINRKEISEVETIFVLFLLSINDCGFNPYIWCMVEIPPIYG